MTTASPSTRRLALLLAGLSMFGPFSIDTIFPAFPLLARELAVDEVAVQQTISVYLLFYGLMSLAHGPLSDAWGRKRVILGGLVVLLDRLDRESLAAKRRITVPFLRQVLDGS